MATTANRKRATKTDMTTTAQQVIPGHTTRRRPQEERNTTADGTSMHPRMDAPPITIRNQVTTKTITHEVPGKIRTNSIHSAAISLRLIPQHNRARTTQEGSRLVDPIIHSDRILAPLRSVHCQTSEGKAAVPRDHRRPMTVEVSNQILAETVTHFNQIWAEKVRSIPSESRRTLKSQYRQRPARAPSTARKEVAQKQHNQRTVLRRTGSHLQGATTTLALTRNRKTSHKTHERTADREVQSNRASKS